MLSKCALLFDKYVIDAAINFTSKITNVFSYVSKLFDEKFVDNFCVLGIAKCIKKKGECFSLNLYKKSSFFQNSFRFSHFVCVNVCLFAQNIIKFIHLM